MLSIPLVAVTQCQLTWALLATIGCSAVRSDDDEMLVIVGVMMVIMIVVMIMVVMLIKLRLYSQVSPALYFLGIAEFRERLLARFT